MMIVPMPVYLLLATISAVALQARSDIICDERIRTFLQCISLPVVQHVLAQIHEHVKSTLELLRNAGIKIWMLTGDKIETATCIAISTKLVARNQYIHQVAKRQWPLARSSVFARR